MIQLGGRSYINFLMELGIPKKLIRLIKMCLSETYNRVRVGKNLSDMFPVRNGLKQGDTFSLKLLSLCVGCIVEICNCLSFLKFI